MNVPKKVEREPYGGPVIKLEGASPEIQPLSPQQYSKKDRDDKVSSAGHRDLHKSGFTLSGELSLTRSHLSLFHPTSLTLYIINSPNLT